MESDADFNPTVGICRIVQGESHIDRYPCPWTPSPTKPRVSLLPEMREGCCRSGSITLTLDEYVQVRPMHSQLRAFMFALLLPRAWLRVRRFNPDLLKYSEM